MLAVADRPARHALRDRGDRHCLVANDQGIWRSPSTRPVLNARGVIFCEMDRIRIAKPGRTPFNGDEVHARLCLAGQQLLRTREIATSLDRCSSI
jgi:hypothetical protein